MPGSSLSSHSSLASSLTELAGALGSKPAAAGEGAVTTSGAPEADSNARASQSAGLYNPFDSDGTSTHLSVLDIYLPVILNTSAVLPLQTTPAWGAMDSLSLNRAQVHISYCVHVSLL